MATEELPNQSLDDIIKNSKKEKFEQRREGSRRGRGGGFRGRSLRRGYSDRRPYRERSREFSRERRPERREDFRDDFRERPRRKIIIRKRSEGRRDSSREEEPQRDTRARLPPQVDSYSPSHTIKVQNFPAQISMHDMLELFQDFGAVRNLSVSWTKKRDSQCTVFVEFGSRKEATKAFDTYDRAEMEGHTLKITFLESDSE